MRGSLRWRSASSRSTPSLWSYSGVGLSAQKDCPKDSCEISAARYTYRVRALALLFLSASLVSASFAAIGDRAIDRSRAEPSVGPEFRLPASLLQYDKGEDLGRDDAATEPPESSLAPEETRLPSLRDERTAIHVAETGDRSAVMIKELKSVHGRTTERDTGDSATESLRRVGSGSGIIWDGEGHIVTNAHVADADGTHSVVFFDESERKARLVGRYPRFDIAVLKVDTEPGFLHPVAKGDSNLLRKGQGVFVIGSPMGFLNSVSRGIVSGLRRELNSLHGSMRGLIQSDAAMNRGNSGGLMLDSTARLIGMPSMILSAVGGNVGMGFAIPVNLMKEVVSRIIRHGHIPYPDLGFQPFHAGEGKYAIPLDGEIRGVIVGEVTPGSDVDKAGITGATKFEQEILGLSRSPLRFSGISTGDLVTRIGDKSILNVKDFYDALDELKIGDEVEVEFYHEEFFGVRTVRIKVGAAP